MWVSEQRRTCVPVRVFLLCVHMRRSLHCDTQERAEQRRLCVRTYLQTSRVRNRIWSRKYWPVCGCVLNSDDQWTKFAPTQLTALTQTHVTRVPANKNKVIKISEFTFNNNTRALEACALVICLFGLVFIMKFFLFRLREITLHTTATIWANSPFGSVSRPLWQRVQWKSTFRYILFAD